MTGRGIPLPPGRGGPPQGVPGSIPGRGQIPLPGRGAIGRGIPPGVSANRPQTPPNVQIQPQPAMTGGQAVFRPIQPIATPQAAPLSRPPTPVSGPIRSPFPPQSHTASAIPSPSPTATIVRPPTPAGVTAMRPTVPVIPGRMRPAAMPPSQVQQPGPQQVLGGVQAMRISPFSPSGPAGDQGSARPRAPTPTASVSSTGTRPQTPSGIVPSQETGAVPKKVGPSPPSSSGQPGQSDTSGARAAAPGSSHAPSALVAENVKQRYGTQGQPFKATSNCIKLAFEPGKGLFEYAVDMDPNEDNRIERGTIMRKLQAIITDTFSMHGSKLLLPFKLPDRVTVAQVKNNARNVMTTVKITFLSSKDLGDPDGMHLLNILFRRIMDELSFVQMKRSFYDPAKSMMVPKYNLEVWPGYVISVSDYEDGLLALCDANFKILRGETVYDVFKVIAGRKATNYQDEAKKEILGLTVVTKYTQKTNNYRIDDIDFTQTPMSTFVQADGTSLSYFDYYKTKYSITIKDTNQPLLINRPKFHGPNDPRSLSLIPELCHIAGISEEMRSDFSVMKAIGEHTRVAPARRQELLTQFLQRVRDNPKASQILSNWGIRLDSNPVSMEGRVLETEMILFGQNKVERINQINGDFTKAATSKPVLEAVNLDNWVIIYPEKLENTVKGFFNTLCKEAARLDIKIAVPQPKKLANDRVETYLKEIRVAAKDPKVQLVMTIVPQQRADRYSAIKKVCYMESPKASQVIVAKTISNAAKLGSVSQKIALQINAKLGGRLWGLKCGLADVMIVGIDVFHDPSSSSTGFKSVAGVVCSMNKDFSSWLSMTANQKPREELVGAISHAFREALEEFFRVNNTLPKKILVFRDGVGDGQLEAVNLVEVMAFEKVIEAVGHVKQPGYKPQFAFIVVQKRINIKIFAQSGTGQYQNPSPGTVVDRTITRRRIYDFYLVSQKVNQGTVTPTHMVVLKDNEGLSADLIQKFAYMMCYMYYNWTGSVRVPAPCQYAHKLAYMVGENLKGTPSAELNKKLFYL